MLAKAAIITIGDELLIGQVVDTNSAYVARELNKIGIQVLRRVAVADDANAIREAIDDAFAFAQVVILTGGLGPTADDITKPLLCDYFGGKLVTNEAALENVKKIFSKLNKPLINSNLKQAEVPDICEVLLNPRGTAPGMWFKKGDAILASLPGVPYEMEGIMEHEVLPRLQSMYTGFYIAHRTMMLSGIGESFLSEQINNFESNLPANIKLAYLPNYGIIRLRLSGSGENREALEHQLDEQFRLLKQEVNSYLVTDEDISLETVLGRLLTDKKETLSTAESCTGGYIAHLLTANPKSSSFFTGSVVCYDTRIKRDVLGVDGDLLDREGAVNEEVSRQMVQGMFKVMNTGYALAVTGLMGPDAGDEKEEVGTTFIAVGKKNGPVESKRFFFRHNRRKNIELTAMNAINMLRLFILNNG